MNAPDRRPTVSSVVATLRMARSAADAEEYLAAVLAAEFSRGKVAALEKVQAILCKPPLPEGAPDATN